MAIENTVSSDFDPCSSIVKNVFDCRLSGVNMIAAKSYPAREHSIQIGAVCVIVVFPDHTYLLFAHDSKEPSK